MEAIFLPSFLPTPPPVDPLLPKERPSAAGNRPWHSRCNRPPAGGDDHEITTEYGSCEPRHAVRVAGHGRSRLATDHVLRAGRRAGERTVRLPRLRLCGRASRPGRGCGEALRHEAEARG